MPSEQQLQKALQGLANSYSTQYQHVHYMYDALRENGFGERIGLIESSRGSKEVCSSDNGFHCEHK